MKPPQDLLDKDKVSEVIVLHDTDLRNEERHSRDFSKQRDECTIGDGFIPLSMDEAEMQIKNYSTI